MQKYDCKDEEAERAKDQQLQWEAAVLDHPPVQRNNGYCKDQEAERARDQQVQWEAAVLAHPPVQRKNGFVWWLNK